MLTDLNRETGERTRSELGGQFGQERVAWTHQDVTDKDQWRLVWDTAEAFFGGPVEGLCNNAGIYETYESTNTNIINVNLLGVTYGTILAMEKMSVKQGGRGGLIVQVSSIGGLIFIPASPLYCAAKTGLLAYVRSHGEEAHRKTKVRLVAICPLLTDTPLVRGAMERQTGELRSMYGMRALHPREVAAGFSKAVRSGLPGSALVIHPALSFYWPDTSSHVFFWYCAASRLIMQVSCRVPAELLQSACRVINCFSIFS